MARVTANKREDLLKGACSAVAERGVRGLRVEDVARRAGVAVSLVYYHFGSRAGLLQALMDYSNERAPATAFAAEGEDQGSGYSRLEAAMLGDIDDGEETRENAVVWQELTASAVFDPELRQQVDAVSSDWTKSLASLIEAGRRDGSVRDDVDPIIESQLLTSLLDGLISRWLSGSLTRERVRRLLSMALEGRLKPDPDGKPGSPRIAVGQPARRK